MEKGEKQKKRGANRSRHFLPKVLWCADIKITPHMLDCENDVRKDLIQRPKIK